MGATKEYRSRKKQSIERTEKRMKQQLDIYKMAHKLFGSKR